MLHVKSKSKVDLRMVLLSIVCSICSAFTLGIITTIFPIATTGFHYMAVIIIGFFYFIFYILFAIPIQLTLNQNSKRHNVTYLTIYVIGAFIAATVAITGLFKENPFFTANFYLIVLLAAIVFWVFDSIFLQNY